MRFPCHLVPKEIAPNLWAGDYFTDLELGKHCQVLVPLSQLDERIWETGFRGEILYYPIPDRGVLPLDVLEELIERILERLKQGFSVGVFCFGGHGRTGYVLTSVIGKLFTGIDPLQYVREELCLRAIESQEQINSIAEFLGMPDLKKHRPASARVENLFLHGIDIGIDLGNWWNK